MFWSICWRINIYFLGHFFQRWVHTFTCRCLFWFLFSLAKTFNLAGQLFSQIILYWLSRTKTTISQFPARTNYAFMYWNPIWWTTNCSYFPATAARFVQKDSLKHNVLNYPKDRSLLYVFRKDRRCIFFYFYWAQLSNLDLINIISSAVLTRKAMKVAGETWQRSRRTSPAAGSYIQPCMVVAILSTSQSVFSLTSNTCTCTCTLTLKKI